MGDALLIEYCRFRTPEKTKCVIPALPIIHLIGEPPDDTSGGHDISRTLEPHARMLFFATFFAGSILHAQNFLSAGASGNLDVKLDSIDSKWSFIQPERVPVRYHRPVGDRHSRKQLSDTHTSHFLPVFGEMRKR